MDLARCKVILTGASGGFGSFLANALKDKVEKLFLVDIDPELMFKFDNQYKIAVFNCDLTNSEQTEWIISEIFKAEPGVNVLINNAGIIHNELLVNLFNRNNRKHSRQNWDKVLNVNLTSAFNCSVNVIDNMIRNKTRGLVLNISSISSSGNSGQTAYSAAKAGINALTVTWSRELGIFGIRTVAIAPGFFDTPSTHNALNDKILEKIKTEIPLKRLGKPEELMNAIIFAIENDYFNGKVLELDGGMTLS